MLADSETVTQILIRFYGRLAEEIQPEIAMDLPSNGLTVRSLRQTLATRLGADRLLDIKVKVVVGDEVVGEDRVIMPNEEVEFLAVVSGG